MDSPTLPATASADGGYQPGFVGRIPVRNLWLLMLYASDLFRTRGIAQRAVEDNPDELPDLVAEILAHAVEVRQRRLLSLGYRPREAVLNRVRGRIDLLRTERGRLQERGMVACRFDDFTMDTPRNRFVRAALARIARIVRRKDLAHRCRALAASMQALGVSSEVPSRAQMSMDRIGRHDADDRLMLSAARLAFDLMLPTEDCGAHLLNLPEREESWARRLFERAVGGFYQVVLGTKGGVQEGTQGWQVKCGTPLEWPISRQSAGMERILPSMRTDVVLDHPGSGRRIVIDTKFTTILTEGWQRAETLRSAHIYQIYAYLRSQSGCGDALADSASGLLLHPAIGQMVDETVLIQGHDIRFATVDLTASSAHIRSRLLHFCAPL